MATASLQTLGGALALGRRVMGKPATVSGSTAITSNCLCSRGGPIRFDLSAFQHLDLRARVQEPQISLTSRAFYWTGLRALPRRPGPFYAGPYWITPLYYARRGRGMKNVRRARLRGPGVEFAGVLHAGLRHHGRDDRCRSRVQAPGERGKCGYNVMMRLPEAPTSRLSPRRRRAKLPRPGRRRCGSARRARRGPSIAFQFGHGLRATALLEPMDLGVLHPTVLLPRCCCRPRAVASGCRSTSSCPELYNFLVAADTLVPGPTGGRLRSADGLRHFLSGEPSRSSVFFAGDFRFRLGGGEWVRKEEWPGDQF